MKSFFLLSLSLIYVNLLSAQVVLERDINQEPAGSSPSLFVELNNVLYFQADDGINGEELYKYDLNTETASLVANIRPYEVGNAMGSIAVLDGKVYFDAREGGSSNYLYVHDPSNNSTQRVVDSNGEEVRNPDNLTVFNGQLFFAAEFSGIDVEFGRYDPATNIVSILADINPDGDSYPSFFTEADGKLWFNAETGQNTSKLWRFDPTTDMVENIVYTTLGGDYPSMNFLYYFDGKFFFRRFIEGEGQELGIYDPVSNSLVDFPPVYPGAGSSSPSGFTEFQGKLYFAGRTVSEGRELRVYDPSTNQVSLAAEISPDDDGNPGLILPLGDKLYFGASISDNERSLFSYDPATQSLAEEATIDNNEFSSFLNVEIVVNGSLFITGARPDVDFELFQFTPGDTNLELAADINQLTIGSDPYGFTPYNGKLYFGADEFNSGREIWVYNPATGNVDILVDAPGSLSPDLFTVLGDKLYFSGIDPVAGYGLLYYDDVTEQISPTSFITPNNTGHITNLTVYDGKLYFSANDDTVDRELHVYDPANNTTSIVMDINPMGDANIRDLFVFENELYFQANDGVTGRELWKYNSSTNQASMIADLNPGADGSSPESLTAYAGELYFVAFVPDLAFDLYSYDPATNMITQRTDVSGNLDPRFLKVYRDKLFFSGRYSPAVNAELVYYDAATDELVLTEDLNPSASNPRYMEVFNDKLYFATFTDEYGRELWEYNDTSLSIVADIRAGVPDSDPQFLTLFNDKLYFSANDGLRGAEIWSIAECLNIFVDTEPQIGEDGFGSIDLTIQGGTPPYTISWSNGADTEDIDGLLPGLYTATVADASGCLSEVTAEVIFVMVNTEELLAEELVRLFPNPTEGAFSLEVENLVVETVEVFDVQGRLFYHKVVTGNSNVREIRLDYAPPGLMW